MRLLSKFSCPAELKRISLPWSLDMVGNLVLDHRRKLKVDEYCLNIENGNIIAYACNDYYAIEEKPEHLQEDECKINTCVIKCQEHDTKTKNLSLVSLHKKYIYVNDTFLKNNRKTILQSKGILNLI